MAFRNQTLMQLRRRLSQAADNGRWPLEMAYWGLTSGQRTQVGIDYFAQLAKQAAAVEKKGAAHTTPEA